MQQEQNPDRITSAPRGRVEETCELTIEHVVRNHNHCINRNRGSIRRRGSKQQQSIASGAYHPRCIAFREMLNERYGQL